MHLKRSFFLVAVLLLILPLGTLLVHAQGGEGVSLENFDLAPRIQAKLDSGEPLVIRVSYHDVSNEFAPFIRQGVEQAAAELGVDAQFVGPVGADADAQIAEIETLLDSIDGLAVSSVSTDALAPIIDRALEMGIPVVTYNTDNPESNRLAFAGQDLVQSGREAGSVMCDLLGGQGTVLITTLDAAAQWSIDRETGARESLEACGVTITATINTGTEPTEIYSTIENAMLANPNVDGIVSLECCSTPAAGEYMVRNDMVGDVVIVGFDLLDQTVQLVQDGAIAATIDQAPVRQGFEAVNLLVRFLNGETITNIDTGVGIYTADNIAEALEPAMARPKASAWKTSRSRPASRPSWTAASRWSSASPTTTYPTNSRPSSVRVSSRPPLNSVSTPSSLAPSARMPMPRSPRSRPCWTASMAWPSPRSAPMPWPRSSTAPWKWASRSSPTTPTIRRATASPSPARTSSSPGVRLARSCATCSVARAPS